MEFYLCWRRKLLKTLVPEWVWPRTVLLDGAEIPIRYTPFSFGTRRILKTGDYEAPERKLLAGILKPGMQVIEMGSSIGAVTAIMAHKTGRTGRIVAIEASASLVDFSVTWLSEYPQVQLVQGFAFPVAQAPAIRITGFEQGRGNLGGVVAFEKDVPDALPDDKVWDINRVCHTFHLQPELLVVDIEGSESIMASEPLDFPPSLRYVLIEFHPGLMPGGSGDVQRIRQALEKDGFRITASSYAVYLFAR